MDHFRIKTSTNSRANQKLSLSERMSLQGYKHLGDYTVTEHLEKIYEILGNNPS